MATQLPQPLTYVYKEVNKGKFKSVRHYEPIKNTCNSLDLTKKVNISKNQNFAKSTPKYWLRTKTGNKWSGYITGLFETDVKDVFWGDINKKQSLVIFKISNDSDLLTIYLFENYYTRELAPILNFINQLQIDN